MPTTNTSLSRSISSYDEVTTTWSESTGLRTTSTSFLDPQKSLFSFTKRTSTKTPNFRALVKSGALLPDNPLSFERMTGGHIFGYTVVTTARNPTSWSQVVRSNCVSNTFVPIATANPWTVSALAPQLIKKAKGSQWLAPVFFIEARKTSSMVYLAAGRLTSMVLALKKGNLKLFISLFHKDARKRGFSKRELKRRSREFRRNFGRDPQSAATRAWLEYKYGWTPFVLDVHSAFKTLSELQDKPTSSVGRIVVTDRRKTSTTVKTGNMCRIGGVTFGGSYTTRHELSARLVWRFTTVENLNTLGKLGLTNPLEVAWELLPLSFVADWFLPIGSYLASVDASYRFKHVGGTLGYKCYSETNFVASNTASTRVTPNTGNGAKVITVSVTPLTSSPLGASLNSLVFDPNLNHGRAASAVALLHGAIRGLSKR